MKTHAWLVGALVAIIVALGGWGLNAISSDRERIAVVETKADIVSERLERIEDKLDALLRR